MQSTERRKREKAKRALSCFLLLASCFLLSACGSSPPIDTLDNELPPGDVLLSERRAFAEGDVTVTILEQLNEVRAFAVFNLTQEMSLLEREAFPDFELSSDAGSRYSSISPVRGEQDTYAVEVGALRPGSSQYCYSLKFLYTYTDRQAQEPDFDARPFELEGCTQ